MKKHLLLLAVGGAGTLMARGIQRAFGAALNVHAVDTDAASGAAGDIPFTLFGGTRLAGRGSGGQAAEARAAFDDDPAVLDDIFKNVRTCVVLTALGGGTGGGATGGILKRLHAQGITSLLFATQPFSFEGAGRNEAAKAEAVALAREADVSVFLPLDDLVSGTDGDNMSQSLRQAHDTVASAVTLLWRLLEKPGYIRLDPERLHTALYGAGRAYFATASATGPSRSDDVLAKLAAHPMIARRSAAVSVRTMLVGVLAGEDLLLREVAAIANGLSAAFGDKTRLDLGTVNDEQTFGGRLCVVLLLFEEDGNPAARGHAADGRRSERALLPMNRFENTQETIWEGENLDIPTFLRRNMTLEK